MHLRFKGYGYTVWFIVLGAFFVFRPLFENFLHGSEETLRHDINAAVLAVSGVMTFLVGAYGDKRSGIDVFSKSAWTSDIMFSQHICFSLPMRLFGVVLMVISLFL